MSVAMSNYFPSLLEPRRPVEQALLSVVQEAIATSPGGTSWQRCRVHFMRNALSRVPRAAQSKVAAFICTIFARPDKESAHRQLRFVADHLRPGYERVAELLEGA